MTGVEAIGDVATGGVIARAVEPGGGEGDGHTPEPNCLNCGCALTGDYCHCCGQRGHIHRTLGEFAHDLLHGVLHFEGKIWRTLPLLVAKPGALTRRYVDGQRVRFVSPIALFLFCVFLTYAVVGWATASQDWTIASTIEEGIKAEQDDLNQLRQKRARATGADAAKLDKKIASTTADLRELEELRSKGVTQATFQDETAVQGNSFFQEAYRKAKQNPDLLLYKLKTNAYKYSWALIPISVPFVWLLFPFSRRFGVYDHTVFVTYSLCFMTLLVVAWAALSMAGLGAVAGFAALIPPVHMFLQLKGTYGLGKWGAAWRTFLLLIFAFTATTLFSMLLLLLGALD